MPVTDIKELYTPGQPPTASSSALSSFIDRRSASPCGYEGRFLMRRNKPVIAIVAGAIGVLGISGVVYVRGGSGSTNSDAATFVHADMTIAKAIAIAERHMGGDAIGTGREYANGTQVFYVEVSKYGQKRKMIVDLQSGRIRNVAMVGGNDV